MPATNTQEFDGTLMVRGHGPLLQLMARSSPNKPGHGSWPG